jgi:glycogen debranching enzyme
LYQQLRVKNFAPHAVDTSLALHFAADFADIYEVRGKSRESRGTDLAPEMSPTRVVLGYQGLDGIVRRTVVGFTPHPLELTSSAARMTLSLATREEMELLLTVSCECGPAIPPSARFE